MRRGLSTTVACPGGPACLHPSPDPGPILDPGAERADLAAVVLLKQRHRPTPERDVAPSVPEGSLGMERVDLLDELGSA